MTKEQLDATYIHTVKETDDNPNAFAKGVKAGETYAMRRISEKLNIPISVLAFIVLDGETVAPSKRAAFEQIKPMLDNLISETFSLQPLEKP